jgi:hypothetical protein
MKGNLQIQLETNDTSLFVEFGARGESMFSVFGPAHEQWQVKLVRDHDAPDGCGEVTVIVGSAVTTVFLGAGTVVAIDYRAAEILGFVAPQVTAARLFDVILQIGTQTVGSSLSPTAEQPLCNQNA